jgi:glycerophosphoryl diester phosphodiesterase
MFDLQGHRGARGLFPENTLEGFVAARLLGLDSFEIDIAITRDGVPVLHHDPALNPDIARWPDGSWLAGRGPLIRSLSLTELAAFDVGRLRPGSAYAQTYASQAAHDGARIPTLEAVLAMDRATRFNIELKLLPQHPEWTVPAEEMVERVLEVVDRADAVDRITIQSFDWRAPRYVRRSRPDIRTGWLTEPKTVAAAALWREDPAATTAMDDVPAAIAAEGGGTWTPFHADLTPSLLDRAHHLGLRVIPWTVNDPADMRRLVEWGVDGLITDWPDRFP